MKKIAAILITLVFSSMASAIPLLFEEGKHYQVIPGVASAEPKLTEYFSFYCPSCFRFEPVANMLKNNLPEGVKFEKSHVDFMRNTSPETQQALSRAMIVSKKLQLSDQVISDIFAQIHVKRQPFQSEQDIIAYIDTLGDHSDKFKQLFNSSGAKRAAKEMKKAQDKLQESGSLTGVPMFVVNDKYKILTRSLKSEKEYRDLVNYLLTLN